MKEINILGETYKITFGDEKEYPALQDCDGFTDTTLKLIVISNMSDSEDSVHRKGDIKQYQKQVARHEILHAFLFESGLDANTFSFSAWATNEEIVDWFAIQYPKLRKIYQELVIE